MFIHTFCVVKYYMYFNTKSDIFAQVFHLSTKTNFAVQICLQNQPLETSTCTCK